MGVTDGGRGGEGLEPRHLLAASVSAAPAADPCAPEMGRGTREGTPRRLFFHSVPPSLGTENFLHPSGSQRKKNIFEKYPSMLIPFFVANSPK